MTISFVTHYQYVYIVVYSKELVTGLYGCSVSTNSGDLLLVFKRMCLRFEVFGGAVSEDLKFAEREEYKDGMNLHASIKDRFYLHVLNICRITPNNCSFSHAAATLSLSFNCLLTWFSS